MLGIFTFTAHTLVDSLCTHSHTHTLTHTVRRPSVTLDVPAGSLLDQEITLTCTAAVNAIITLTVVDSEGTVLLMTDMTGISTSVNVTVTRTGQHNVTCEADNNGLTEMAMEQFYGISKL